MKSAIFFALALFLVGAYLYGNAESLWGVPPVLASAGLALWIAWTLPTSEPNEKNARRPEARTKELETRENLSDREAIARGA